MFSPSESKFRRLLSSRSSGSVSLEPIWDCYQLECPDDSNKTTFALHACWELPASGIQELGEIPNTCLIKSTVWKSLSKREILIIKWLGVISRAYWCRWDTTLSLLAVSGLLCAIPWNRRAESHCEQLQKLTNHGSLRQGNGIRELLYLYVILSCSPWTGDYFGADNATRNTGSQAIRETCNEFQGVSILNIWKRKPVRNPSKWAFSLESVGFLHGRDAYSLKISSFQKRGFHLSFIPSQGVLLQTFTFDHQQFSN